MSIQNKKLTNSEKIYSKDGEEMTPPTVAQRIQSTRIMG